MITKNIPYVFLMTWGIIALLILWSSKRPTRRRRK